MALDRPRLGEVPDKGSVNELHVTLVEVVVEEILEIAEDEDDPALATAAENLPRQGNDPLNQDLYEWIKRQLPARVHGELLRLAKRIEWPYIPTDLPQHATSASTAAPSVSRLHRETPMFQHADWLHFAIIIQDEWMPPASASHISRKRRRERADSVQMKP